MTGTTSDLLGKVRDVAFASAIFLYFAGFVFRRAYFEQFGIPITVFTTDTLILPVYAYTVFVDAWWIFTIFAAGSGLVALILRSAIRGKRRRRARWFLRTWYVPLIAVAAFPIIAVSAQLAARHERGAYLDKARTPSESLTLAIENFKPETADSGGKALASAAYGHQLHLLALTEKTVFVVLPRPSDDPSGAGDLLVFGIPRDKLSHFEVDIQL